MLHRKYSLTTIQIQIGYGTHIAEVVIPVFYIMQVVRTRISSTKGTGIDNRVISTAVEVLRQRTYITM